MAHIGVWRSELGFWCLGFGGCGVWSLRSGGLGFRVWSLGV